MSDRDDEVARLRAELDKAEPGDERDAEVRLRLAEALLEDFESRADVAVLAGASVELGGLDEVRHHAEYVTTWASPGSPAWVWAQQLRVLVFSHRYTVLGDVRELDHTIAALRTLLVHVDLVDQRTDLGDLLLQRYSVAPADDCTHLVEAIDLLRALSATELTGTQRGPVDSLLGLALLERFHRDREHARATAGQLSEAQSVLGGSLRFLDLDHPQRAEVILELGRLHRFRAVVNDGEFSTDAEGDLDEAIHLFRSSAGEDPRAALDLAEVLASRYMDRADPAERDEAIELLQRLEGEPGLTSSPTERAAVLGELLLSRAKEHPGEIDDLVSYLEAALDLAERVDGPLNMLLIETYCLRKEPRPTEVDRMVHVVDAMMVTDLTEMPDKLTLLALRSAAASALALRTRTPEELNHAARQLREASRHVLPFDWTHLALLGLLGIVVVVQHDHEVAVDWADPIRLVREFPPGRRADLLRWLEAHHDVVPEGNTDISAAVALLHSDQTGHAVGGSIAEQERVRREAITALEAARAVLPADDILDLVLQEQIGYQYCELGRLLERAEEINRAVALLDDLIGRMGADHPLHTTTLALYAAAVMTARLYSGPGLTFRHARTSLTRAIEDPDLEPTVKSMFLHVLAHVEGMAWLEDSRTGSITTAIDYCQRALNLLSEDDPRHDDVRHSLVSLLIDRFKMVGEIHDLDAAAKHLHALRDIVRERGNDAVLTEAAVAEMIEDVEFERVAAQLTSSTHEDIDRRLAHLTVRLVALEKRTAAGERVDGIAIAALRSSVAAALMQKAHLSADLESFNAATELLATAAASIQHGTAPWVWFQISAGIAAALSGATRADQEMFDEGTSKLAAVWEDDELAADHRAQAALALVYSWLAWQLRTRDEAALDVALDHFDCVGALGGQLYERLDTALLLDQLGEALWNRGRPGDGDRALDIGFKSLRKRAGDVLLQTAGEHGLQRAADAAGRALTIAVRCLTVGRRERAVEAVESGRGLVLHTMTVTTDVATLLRECGRDELADEWQRAAAIESARQDPFAPPGSPPFTEGALGFAVDFAPSDLRHRVLTTLFGESSSHLLLSPPSVAEIAVALQELESDALVYLIPTQGEHSGRALLVTAGAQTHDVVLPLLNDDLRGQIGQYLDARRAAESPDLPQELVDAADATWHRELEALCGWAWRAVIGPLLKRIRRLGLGATLPRLVLVPSGALGVVPWHAARGDGRIAVQDAVFSYAASARQLCDLAGRPRRPLAEIPVVVTDPMGTLPGAPTEAEFLYHCYPNGRFYGIEVDGVPHSGNGTPQEVLSAVPGAGQPGASVLHLGCHARSGATLSQTYLDQLLDGSVLAVDRILDRARNRPRGAVGGLVVLAACQSDLTEAAHDEALTLASTFVAAGATGVVGTKWVVYDIQTSVLMCVFHAELTRMHKRPRDALRAVQLWALDPERSDPGGLPSYLAHKLRSLDLSHPVFWAGFTHQGW